MSDLQNLIGLQSNGKSLGVLRSEWVWALENKAKRDAVAGISHAPLSGDENYRLHVACIEEGVNAHYHMKGAEHYAIAAGSGHLHLGSVEDGVVTWHEPIFVKLGDSFTIPEGYAHRLENIEPMSLVIIFGCPDSHLVDTADRFIVPNPNV